MLEFKSNNIFDLLKLTTTRIVRIYLLQDKVVCTAQLYIAQLVAVDFPQQQPPYLENINWYLEDKEHESKP